jgi:hypothetical protein
VTGHGYDTYHMRVTKHTHPPLRASFKPAREWSKVGPSPSEVSTSASRASRQSSRSNHVCMLRQTGGGCQLCGWLLVMGGGSG